MTETYLFERAEIIIFYLIFLLKGLNYIAGMLLLITKNEENSFWLLTEMVENIVPGLFEFVYPINDIMFFDTVSEGK